MNTLLALLLLNDGYLNSGEGPARLGKGESTVRMVSEDVRLLIGKEVVQTTCEFVFRNEGNATTVRMGFPNNISNMTSDEYAGEKLRPILKRFKTWVDGQGMPARLVRAAKDDRNWSYYVKEVPFAKRQTRRVRVRYETDIGGLAAVKGYQKLAGYILDSGKGWKGTIWRATVSATFLPSSGLATPIRAFEGDATIYPMPPTRAKLLEDARVVWVRAPGTITVKGRTVSTTARDLEPEESSNFFLSWGKEG